jgi:hypothetical protein
VITTPGVDAGAVGHEPRVICGDAPCASPRTDRSTTSSQTQFAWTQIIQRCVFNKNSLTPYGATILFRPTVLTDAATGQQSPLNCPRMPPVPIPPRQDRHTGVNLLDAPGLTPVPRQNTRSQRDMCGCSPQRRCNRVCRSVACYSVDFAARSDPLGSSPKLRSCSASSSRSCLFRSSANWRQAPG